MTTYPIFLPQYRDVTVVQRTRDYLVDGERYQRVTAALGIINKPALVPWARRVTLEKVQAVLSDPSVVGELARFSYQFEEGATTPDKGEYMGWVDRLIAAADAYPDQVRGEKAALGTEIHQMLRDATQLSPADQSAYLEVVPNDQRPAFTGALAFLRDHSIKVVATEQPVWSDKHKIAGTVDGVGWVGSALVIWDWKRSAGVYWETALQLGAYAEYLGRLMGVPVEKAWAVRLLREPPAPDAPLYEVHQVRNKAAAYAAYLDACGLYEASKNKEWWAA